MGAQIFQLFHERESHEIARLRRMLAFFSASLCFSCELAGYFGQQLPATQCGHCSACQGGRLTLPPPRAVAPMASHDYHALTRALIGLAQGPPSSVALARFLCGITTPALPPQKVKHLPGFGALEHYSFPEVKAWVAGRATGFVAHAD
jgi:ATP-dependent DNA helicase RecQ